MQEQFVFSGFGGQGVMFAGQLLAYAAMDAGYHVTWIPSYGPEMRGGTAHCHVVISDRPIGSPIVRNPRAGIVFNNPSFDRYIDVIAPNGLFAYNASLIDRTVEREDITALAVPAAELAEAAGGIRLSNVVMLGAVFAVHPVITLDHIHAALSAHLPAHRQSMLGQNLDALESGATFGRSLRVDLTRA
jgi:2-oxoglutarate ferredoxin oxidoreductase subunit gamma